MGWCSLILVVGSAALITSFPSAQQASAAPVGTITNFSPSATQPLQITQGPDGALWFTNPADNSIGRITTDGVTSGFTDPSIDEPEGITAGPDDALWFTNEGNNSIGRISPTGVVTNFTDPTIDEPVGIANGSDDALWFTNEGNSSIGRISPTGAVTNFPLGSFGPSAFGKPTQIVAGPDGNLWVMSDARGGVARITTDGTVTIFNGTPDLIGLIEAITNGPDGNIWVTSAVLNGRSFTDDIEQITPDGTTTDFVLPFAQGQTGITTGPDGALWFTNRATHSIDQFTTDGTLTSFANPGINDPEGITPGPDGALWFANAGTNSIGRITTDGDVTFFPTTPQIAPLGIATGSDGALWFSNLNSDSIGRITTGGTFTQFTDPSINDPRVMVAGPDGALWFINNGTNSIGRITTDGVVTNFTGPAISAPRAITVGPDDALWFVNDSNSTIGRITTGGTISSFSDPSINSPLWITSGPDGALWFTNFGNNSIGRITTGGVVTNFRAPNGKIVGPDGITAGPDGALWFTSIDNNSIGRITPAGAVTMFTDPSFGGPENITAGPDGALWFTNDGNNAIGRITTDGVVTSYPDSALQDGTFDITAGPDDALWFTTEDGTIGRIQSAPPTPQTITFTSTPPASPTVGSTYQVSATGGDSGNPVVFSIDATSTPGTCSVLGSTVTFTSDGSCVIDADQAGNTTFAAAPEMSQTLAIQQAAPACAPGASDCQSQVGSDPNGSLEVTSGGPDGVTASTTGTGALTVGHYATNPVATPAVGATGEYFDVAVSSDNQFSALTIEDCNLVGGNVVQWWNPVASGGAGAWQPVSNQTYVPGSPDCATITVDPSTSPDLDQLVGTIFTVVNVTSKPTVTSAATTTFTAGSAGTFTVTTAGFPTPALTFTGTLPSPLNFVDNGDGTATISGVPATGTAKTYTLKIKATNGAGSATQTFSLVVNQVPTVTSAAAATFTIGKATSFKVATTGSPAAALTEAGTLPQGLNFVDNGGGKATLSGTPAAGTSGTYPLTITAANSAGSTPQSFTLVVNQVPTVTSAATTTFTAGSAGTFTVTTAGFPTPALTFTGTLPSPLNFVDNGDGTATISGVPATGTAKTYTLKIKATNGAGSATQTFSLVVNQVPTVTSAATATFTIGKASSFKVATTGSPAAALTEAGTLPQGLNFVDNGGGKATLSGTPAAGTSGTYPLTITAANSAGSTPQSFTLVVNQVPTVTSAATTTFTAGSAGTFTVTTAGFPTPALTFTGTLPSPLNFVDNGDGTATISGVPATGTAKTYTLKIKATNGAGSVTQTFSLVVKK